MTTPDKEEMPTDRTAGNFWAEKRDGRWQLQMRHRGPGSSFCVAQINHWADNPEALTTRIADACNAYEPMREALAEMIYEATHLSPENPDGGHSCVISGLTLTKARDALSGIAAPTKSTAITDGLIEALKFYAGETIHGMAGDNGYRARAALSTLPVNDRQTSDDVGILRDAARRAHDTLIEINQYNYTHADVCELNDASVEAILILADAIGERHGKTEKWWNDRRAALKGVPQPASDDYQADASAPALSEKVNVRSESRDER